MYPITLFTVTERVATAFKLAIDGKLKTPDIAKFEEECGNAWTEIIKGESNISVVSVLQVQFQVSNNFIIEVLPHFQIRDMIWGLVM